MSNLINQHAGQAFESISMQEALVQIKNEIEEAIILKGEKGKNALIRSQRPIKLIHDVVKTAFLDKGVHPSLINPGLPQLQNAAKINKGTENDNSVNIDSEINLEDKEMKLSGYLKTKSQDISIIPKNIKPESEILSYPTLLYGAEDKFGTRFTESVLSVNVRSQLSSVAKNFDTLYERTFAESLNFHLRSPKMVLGEVYMIILKEYDSYAAQKNKVSFKDSNYIEKYILSFQTLNNRESIEDYEFKYERVALLVVDFSQEVPKLYNSTKELIEDGILEVDSRACINSLSFDSFVEDLLGIYYDRFPENCFN